MRFFHRQSSPEASPAVPTRPTMSALSTFDLDRVTGGDDVCGGGGDWEGGGDMGDEDVGDEDPCGE